MRTKNIIALYIYLQSKTLSSSIWPEINDGDKTGALRQMCVALEVVKGSCGKLGQKNHFGVRTIGGRMVWVAFQSWDLSDRTAGTEALRCRKSHMGRSAGVGMWGCG